MATNLGKAMESQSALSRRDEIEMIFSKDSLH